MLLPCAQDYNNKKQLINEDLPIIEESITRWYPITMKLYGLPNCTLIPRNQVPLETMLRNIAECKFRLMV